MFNRTDAKTIGLRIGARVVFHKQELARTNDHYVREVLRKSAAGVVDELVGKYAKRIKAERNELLGVEYVLDAWILTRDEVDELFAQAYDAGAHDGARWGYPPMTFPATQQEARAVDDEMVERALAASDAYWAAPENQATCPQCEGSGAVAVGTEGDRDWCDCQFGTTTTGTEHGAMRAALIAAQQASP